MAEVIARKSKDPLSSACHQAATTVASAIIEQATNKTSPQVCENSASFDFILLNAFPFK
jgi:hypothetical protein